MDHLARRISVRQVSAAICASIDFYQFLSIFINRLSIFIDKRLIWCDKSKKCGFLNHLLQNKSLWVRPPFLNSWKSANFLLFRVAYRSFRFYLAGYWRSLSLKPWPSMLRLIYSYLFSHYLSIMSDSLSIGWSEPPFPNTTPAFSYSSEFLSFF